MESEKGIRVSMKFKTAIFVGGIFLSFAAFGASDARAFSLGETKNFYIDPSYDNAGRQTINATLRNVSEKALFYIEDDLWVQSTNKIETDALIANLALEFDKNIYPRLTSVFGQEWSPGIDNEFRITILITKMKSNAGGYFDIIDELPKTLAPASNEREMVYLNGTYLSSYRAKAFLAHEFQHLISYYQKEKSKNLLEETWLNEARSEYAATLLGYDDPLQGSNLQKRLNDFLVNPSDSLTEWQNKIADYAAANLFMQYLVGRYGEDILTKIMRAPAVGISSIDWALADRGVSERFGDVFVDWTITNYINDCSAGVNQKYCYGVRLPYSSFHLTPTKSASVKVENGTIFSFSDQVKDWTGHWYEISPLGSGFNLEISFSGSDVSNFRVPILVFYNDGTRAIKFLNLYDQWGTDIIADFGAKVKAVVLIPSNQTVTSGFSSAEPLYPLSYYAKITSVALPILSPSPSPLPESSPSPQPSPIAVQTPAAPNYPDGSLIRATGDYKVYIIKGKYKRWIQSPQILAAYPHLGWSAVIEVTPAERDWYQDAWLIRADGDYKVYEINGDFTKHWLNISADQFNFSGRLWDMVFVINKAERDLYKIGTEVLR